MLQDRHRALVRLTRVRADQEEANELLLVGIESSVRLV